MCAIGRSQKVVFKVREMGKNTVKVKRERVTRSRSVSSSSSTSRNRSKSPQKTSKKTFEKSADNNISVHSTASPKPTKQRYESTILNKYLENGSLKVLTANRNPPALTRQDISTEDEVWLFQCPHSVDVEKLVGTKLKLNSQQHIVLADDSTKFEYHSESPVTNQYYTVISKSAEKDKHEAYSFRAAGVVRIQHEIPEPLHCGAAEIVDLKVPYPQNLKVRHPLLGFEFEKKTKLNKTVRRSLRQAVTDSNIAKAQNHMKEEERNTSEQKKKSSANIELDYDVIMGLNEKASVKAEEFVEMEVPKRIKRKLHDKSNCEEVISPKKHKSKRIKLEDGLVEDLGWISTL